MIISASRRTDIPSFYGDWLVNRLREGVILVRNPMNPQIISSIPLNPEIVDCIVFWTKDPGPFLPKLTNLDELGYRYYFLFTLNPYDGKFERKLDRVKNIIRTFKELSRMIGPNKVVWRYDPVILSEELTLEYHMDRFSALSDELSGYTDKCIFSFLHRYPGMESHITKFKYVTADPGMIDEFASQTSRTLRDRNIRLFSCAQDIDLKQYGIEHSKCIDDELISKICGYEIKSKKDPSQRKWCGCIESRDIGTYNTCTHQCIYCYANADPGLAKRNRVAHDPHSPMLCDTPTGHEKIIGHKDAKSSRKDNIMEQKLLFSGENGNE